MVFQRCFKEAALLWKFAIEGLKYELRIDVTGEILLTLVGGCSRKGAVARTDIYDLYRHDPRVDDANLVTNGLSVLQRAKGLILSYVRQYRPWRLSITATTSRKTAIYRRLANRALREFDGYFLVEAPIGTFSAYRLVENAA